MIAEATPGLVQRDRSALLVVDVQERLAPAVLEPERVIRNAGILIEAARRLGVPILLSEQYPKGLGPTVAELRALAPEGANFAKITFSCAAEPAIRRRLEDFGRDHVVVCGMEAHVCVLQTAFGLKARGLVPFVVADATSSRRAENRDAALARLRDYAIPVVTTEMVVFEWLARAGSDEFREISRLIR